MQHPVLAHPEEAEKFPPTMGTGVWHKLGVPAAQHESMTSLPKSRFWHRTSSSEHMLPMRLACGLLQLASPAHQPGHCGFVQLLQLKQGTS